MTTLRYAVDIVLCVDVTGSMRPLLDGVRDGAPSFRDRLAGAMAGHGRSVGRLRVKVVAFRGSAGGALAETDFLVLPEQAPDLEKFVRHLEPGGRCPASGLEALALAINSPWERGLDRRRHVIALCTDAPTHPRYPPRAMDDLFERWGYARSTAAVMENAAKRLVLFAPEVDPWTAIAEDWNLTVLVPAEPGAGLAEFGMDRIVRTIAHLL